MSLHSNSGHCDYCQKVMNRYPGFHQTLRAWFESFQAAHPEAHMSCAGRGRQDQEAAFIRRASKAHYGKSAHNYNAAMDIFKWAATVEEMYAIEWFENTVKPALTSNLDWYGKPHAPFYERPHIEIANWEELLKQGSLKLVE